MSNPTDPAAAREKILDSAFLEDGETVIPGTRGRSIRLRPFSTILARYIDDLGLTFLQGQIEGLAQGELFRQLAVFAWFHSEPIPTVLRAMRDGSWREAAEVWEAENMDLASVKELLREAVRWAGQAEAAAFELMPRAADDDTPETDPPGNS